MADRRTELDVPPDILTTLYSEQAVSILWEDLRKYVGYSYNQIDTINKTRKLLKMLMTCENIDIGPTRIWSYTTNSEVRHLAYKAESSPVFAALIKSVTSTLWNTPFKQVIDVLMENYYRGWIQHHKKYPRISSTTSARRCAI